MKHINPHMCISEEEDDISFEWWDGNRKISAIFDADGSTQLIALEAGEFVDDPTSLFAAYSWLVATPPAREGEGE